MQQNFWSFQGCTYLTFSVLGPAFKMAASDSSTDESLYPIAVLIDELKNEDVQVFLYIFIYLSW